MKIVTLKLFGREILRLESSEEATASDIVQAMVAQRLSEGSFEEAEVEDPAAPDKFSDLNWGERLVWDARDAD